MYEYDCTEVRGVPGEHVEIRFLESTGLPALKTMIYRSSQDIHIQKFPEALSISLNVLCPPQKSMRDQYAFDIGNSSIAHIIRSFATGQKLLIEAAAALCDGAIDDVLVFISQRHSDPRTRMTAEQALARRAGLAS
ncbi:MAG: hypothetical protein WAU78_01515 [Roseiarcus sp.]